MTEEEGRRLFLLIRGSIVVTIDDEFRKRSLNDVWDFKYGIKTIWHTYFKEEERLRTVEARIDNAAGRV
jgi:hypothetical protein